MTSPQADTTATLAAAVAVVSVFAGAHLIRTNDVAGIRAAVLLADELMRGAKRAAEPATTAARPYPQEDHAPRPVRPSTKRP